MRRGEIVAVALSGDYGKPHPAVVVQSDYFEALPSATVLPLTSTLYDAHLMRITVTPTEENGLKVPSQVMVDKAMTVPRSKIGPRIGHLETAAMRSVDEALARFLGLA